jgi:hypothetical protein
VILQGFSHFLVSYPQAYPLAELLALSPPLRRLVDRDSTLGGLFLITTHVVAVRIPGPGSIIEPPAITNCPMSEVRSEKAYEALGRFVEAFESMVHETRSITIRPLSDNKNMHHHGLIEIAFHHYCMTAKPLFEIFRAIIIQIVNVSIEVQEIRKKSGRDDYPLPIVDSFGKSVSFIPSDREKFLGVLKTIAKEYGDLMDLRNGLLHGSWFVGYDSSIDFDLHKYIVTKEGLARVDLPKTTSELLELCDRCENVIPWLHKIEGCVTGMYKISDEFQRSESDWVISAGHTTLPKKSL